jgi:TRAP-type C4-dicarboxylate transport system substrate-binding protein
MTGPRITINTSYYEKLPPDLKRVLQDSVTEALAWQRQLGQKLEDELVGQMRGAGVTVITPDQTFRKNLVTASHQFNKEYVEKLGPKAAELYATLQKLIAETK